MRILVLILLQSTNVILVYFFSDFSDFDVPAKQEFWYSSLNLNDTEYVDTNNYMCDTDWEVLSTIHCFSASIEAFYSKICDLKLPILPSVTKEHDYIA